MTSIRHPGDSFRRFGFSIRHFDDSFRRFGPSFRRFDYLPSPRIFIPSL
ncbi:hypothetical protein ABH966_004491 [Lysinibacillus sp. RC46]